MENSDEMQKIIDNEHLKLLTLFHYISGGLTLAFSLFIGGYFFLVYFLIASSGLHAENSPAMNDTMPEAFLTIMLTIMIIVFILALSFGVVQLVSGRLIGLRKKRLFSFAVAIVNLISIPYGTILGVLTIIVLERQSVHNQYLKQN